MITPEIVPPPAEKRGILMSLLRGQQNNRQASTTTMTQSLQEDNTDDSSDAEEELVACYSSTAVSANKQQLPATPPDMSDLTFVIGDLSITKKPSSKRCKRALRKLFVMSEHAFYKTNRIEMVRAAEGRLVPTLFDFLERSEKGSSEQNLALLVLNNLSVPDENKSLIAMDYGGARCLSRLLISNPSCHLTTIILVNLTFCDLELRRALVAYGSDIALVESLSLALRVSSLTLGELEARHHLFDLDADKLKTPAEMLATLLAEDYRMHQDLPDTVVVLPQNPEDDRVSYQSSFGVIPAPARQLYPNTARWCLCALKNLTRPSCDESAAYMVIHSGIVRHILRFITFSDSPSSNIQDVVLEQRTDSVDQRNHATFQRCGMDETGPRACSSKSSDTGILQSPPAFTNSPIYWNSHTAQDAALSVVLNLAAASSVRDYIREMDTVRLLVQITTFASDSKTALPCAENSEVLEFQSLKARMALAYLVGSEGHFGQNMISSGLSEAAQYLGHDDLILLATDSDITLLLEFLANTISLRQKEGQGGYSASTLNVKSVVFAIRCLLVLHWNRVRMSELVGPQINTLLMKVLATHCLQNNRALDAETAEYACFSMYLLSNHGFQRPFLPAYFGHYSDESLSLAAKVLIAYAEKDDITPPGKHAANQLLMRLKYLSFEGDAEDLFSAPAVQSLSIELSDFIFENDLVVASEAIVITNCKAGAIPRHDIFDRPILRSEALREDNKNRLPWRNYANVDSFPSVLCAVEELSFESAKVGHFDPIDDIQIANNIANSANGEKTESYHYIWSWEDTAGQIHRNLDKKSSNSFLGFTQARRARDHLMGALSCAVELDYLCGVDTTLHH